MSNRRNSFVPQRGRGRDLTVVWGVNGQVGSVVGEVIETRKVVADNDFLAEDNSED